MLDSEQKDAHPVTSSSSSSCSSFGTSNARALTSLLLALDTSLLGPHPYAPLVESEKAKTCFHHASGVRYIHHQEKNHEGPSRNKKVGRASGKVCYLLISLLTLDPKMNQMPLVSVKTPARRRRGTHEGGTRGGGGLDSIFAK